MRRIFRTSCGQLAKKFPVRPAHPERTCWGCDKYCPSDALVCGNGSERTQQPVELFGEDCQTANSRMAMGVRLVNPCSAK